MKNVFKEEIIYAHRIPARIVHQDHREKKSELLPHWHKEVELNLLSEGSYDYMVNGKPVHVEEGGIILINSENIHSGKRPDGQAREKGVTILMDADYIRSYLSPGEALYFETDMEEADRERLKDLMLKIDKAYVEHSPFHEMEITAHLLQIEKLLLSNYLKPFEEQQLDMERSDLKKIQGALRFLDEHYGEPVTLQEVANICGYNYSYFSRKFKQLTGTTFQQYLNNIRLKNAVKDLVHSDDSITEISFRNGYPNVKAFIESFKIKYEMTPNKYRATQVGQ